MINEITDGLKQYRPQLKNPGVQQGSAFADILAENLQQGKPAAKVPDKWADGQPGNVFGAVSEFMLENYGVDIYDRTPTHEITADQKAWLCSRYDFSNFSVSVEETFVAADGTVQGYRHHTQEYSNFLGDLVYLNVVTPKEANSLSAVSIPAHTAVFRPSSGTLAYDADGGSADSFVEAMRMVIERQRGYIDYIREKSGKPSTAQPEDLEYLRNANGFLADKMKLYDILLDLFG